MTAPLSPEDFIAPTIEPAPGQVFDLEEEPTPPSEPSASPFPEPILKLSEADLTEILNHLDEQILAMKAAQEPKLREFAAYEKAYRASPEPQKSFPFEGASNEVIPVVGMAVDPVFARLETGIFKQDPVIRLKSLRKSIQPYIRALEDFVESYQRNQLKLRQVAAPRLLEEAKLGTCVFRTEYDRIEHTFRTYEPSNNWAVIEKKEVEFAGPRVFGVALDNFLFPANRQTIQECSIVAERIYMEEWQLRVAEQSGKIKNVDSIIGHTSQQRSMLDDARAALSNHQQPSRDFNEYELYYVWFDYSLKSDKGRVARYRALYHLDTRTLLLLQYNPYFHQRKPYTVIPYVITNGSLYGMGIGEMVKPFQDAITRWEQMASDNAYLANIRMFIAKRESGIEYMPRLYSGRVFFVDDPTKDFIPFAAADVYGSTLLERQNLFGMAEKRTGVSDYLTGRESPIIGSRATATSTLALIQEGTRRVEQVLENIRVGIAEIIEFCFHIWAQYGLEGVEDMIFRDDESAGLVKEFFDRATTESVRGALSIDLSVTDAGSSNQVLQQMQLTIIQTMMTYLEKVLQAGAQALQARETLPEFTEMVKDVMSRARKMFLDLLNKYKVPDPESYLPDLERFLGLPTQLSATAPGTAPGAEGFSGGFAPAPRLSPPTSPSGAAPFPRPAQPGSGGGPLGNGTPSGLVPGASI